MTPSISAWHHDFSNNGRDLFAIQVQTCKMYLWYILGRYQQAKREKFKKCRIPSKVSTGEGLKNAKNEKNAGYSSCGAVSIIEHRAQSRHKSDSLHCYEPCRASDRSTAVEILDSREVISSALRRSTCTCIAKTSLMLVMCVLAAEFHWKS